MSVRWTSAWRIEPPAARHARAAGVTFPEPLDHGLLRALGVADVPGGRNRGESPSTRTRRVASSRRRALAQRRLFPVGARRCSRIWPAIASAARSRSTSSRGRTSQRRREPFPVSFWWRLRPPGRGRPGASPHPLGSAGRSRLRGARAPAPAGGAAHQRARLDVDEAEVERDRLELAELVGVVGRPSAHAPRWAADTGRWSGSRSPPAADPGRSPPARRALRRARPSSRSWSGMSGA